MPRNLPLYGRLRSRAPQQRRPEVNLFALPHAQHTQSYAPHVLAPGAGQFLPAFLVENAPNPLPEAHTLAGRTDLLLQRSSLRPGRSPLQASVQSLAVPVWRRGYKDGAGRRALFNQPTGLAVNRQGFVFVADTLNHCIRRISPGGRVKTWMGPRMGLHRPTGLASGLDQSLWIVDQGNGLLRWASRYRDISTFTLPVPPLGGIAHHDGLVYLTVKLPQGTSLLRFHPTHQESALLTDWEGQLQWIPYQKGDEERPFSRWWQGRQHYPTPYLLSHQAQDGLGLCISPKQELLWAEGLHLQRLSLKTLRLNTQTLSFPAWPHPKWRGIQALPNQQVLLLDANHNALYLHDEQGLRLAAMVPEGLEQPYGLAQNAYGQVFLSDTGHWRVCRLNLPGNGPLLHLARLAFLPYLPQEPVVRELKKGVHALVKRYLGPAKVEAPTPALPGIAQQYILDVLHQGQQAQQLACVKELMDVLSHPVTSTETAHLTQARPLLQAMLSHEDVAVRSLVIQRLGDTLHREQEALFWLGLLELAPEPNRLLKKYRLEMLSFMGKRFQLYGHVVPLMVPYISAPEEDVVEAAFAQLMKVREAGFASLVDPLVEALRETP